MQKRLLHARVRGQYMANGPLMRAVLSLLPPLPAVTVKRPAKRVVAVLGVLGLAVFLLSFGPQKARAITADSDLNFQSRLLTSGGAVVPDGNYNIDFKIYNADSTTGTVGTCSGSCLWEETRTNAGGHGVAVVNGYFSVNLGSVTPFPSTINWDQQLYLTMNLTTDGTQTGAPISTDWDGEMQNSGHSIALTSVPLAFRANQLALTGTNEQILQFASNTFGQATTISLPDPGASTATICYQGASACGFESTSGNDFIKNQTASLQQANFRIQSATSGSIAAAITGAAGQSVDILDVNANGGANPLFSIGDTGNATFRVASGQDSPTAFQIQNAAGNTYIGVDTSGANLYLGNTGIASTIQVGNTTGAVAQTIDIGNNGTALSTTIIIIGSTVGASGTTIQAGSAGITLGANTADSGNLDITGSTAFKKGTDFSTTGTTNNANFSNASLVRLTGASAQTITGIANGRDGYILSIVNAGSVAAIFTNNDSNSSAANRITTGTNGSISLPVGGSLTLIYDAGASLWRVSSGELSLQNSYSNSASPQITLSSSLGGLVLQDASSPIGADLFTVQSNGGGSKFLDVTSSGISVAGSVTSTGNINTSGGALQTNGTTRIDNSGNLTNISNLDLSGSAAFKKGTDFSTTGISNNVNFGNASLVRLTGASAQTITGIANGRDGYILTLVNAGSVAATIKNLSGSSSAANQISTSTGGDITLPVGGALTLIYDSGASLWRTTSGSSSLQTAYNNSTSSPQITLNSTNGGLVIQDAASLSNSFQIQNAAGSDILNVATSVTVQLISNNSMEQSIDGWTPTSSTLLLSDTQAKFGSRSLLISTNTTITAGAYYRVQLQSSTQYSFSVWLYCNTGGAIGGAACTSDINIGRDDTVGSPIPCLSTQTVPSNTWTQFSCTFSAGTTDQTSDFYIRQTDNTAKNIYVDGLSLVQGASPFSYVPPANNFNVDANTSTIILNSTNSGQLTGWTSSVNILPSSSNRKLADSVVVNGYIYELGGASGTTGLTTIYYTKVNANGTIGAWQTESTGLPVGIVAGAVAAANGYIYMIGGIATYAAGNSYSSVYYAKVNNDGTLGTWITSPNSLPSARDRLTVISADGYLIAMGGENTVSGTQTAQSSVYTAKLNPDGSTSAWTTNVQSLPGARYGGEAVVANGYIYFMGGNDGSTTHSDVYYNSVAGVVAGFGTSGGTVWNTLSNTPLSTADMSGTAVTADGYVYVLGGTGSNGDSSGSGLSTVLFAKLNSDGTLGSWQINSLNMPDARIRHTSVIANGYIYVIAGVDTSSTTNNVYYASTARVEVGGSLDLVGLAGDDQTNSGSGGSLTAGNTKIVGTLEVQDQAQFWGSLNVNQNFTVGGSAVFQNTTGSTTAFQIQNASASYILSVDNTGDSSNLITNGSFELSTLGWAGDGTGPATISSTTSQAYIGSASAQVVTTAHAGDGIESSTVSLAPSTVYTLTLQAKASGSNITSNFEIGHNDNNGSGEQSCLTSQTVVTSGWTRFSCQFTTGGCATSCSTYVYAKQLDATSRTFYIDAVKLELGSTATGYKEGTISLAGSINSPTIFRNATNSTTAFRIQDASASNTLFAVDTLNDTVTINGLAGSGANLTSLNASNVSSGTLAAGRLPADVALLDGNSQIFTGNNQLFQNAANSTTAFRVMDHGGTTVLGIDTTSNDLVTVANLTVTGTCSGCGGASAGDLQTAYNNSISPATITLADNKNLVVNAQDTATDPSILFNLQCTTCSAGGGILAVQSGGTNVLTVNPNGGSVLFENSSNSTTAFTIQAASSGNKLLVADTSDSRLYVGDPTADSTGIDLVLDNKNTSGDPTGVNGAMYYNSNSSQFRCYNGSWTNCITNILAFAQTSVVAGDTVANTTTETPFADNYSIPANSMQAGQVYRVTARGIYSNTSTGGNNLFTFKVKMGPTTIGATASAQASSSIINFAWELSFNIIVDTTGSSGTVEGQGYVNCFTSGQAATNKQMVNTGTVTVDTTSAQTLQISMTWGTANASNTITMRQLIVERLGQVN